MNASGSFQRFQSRASDYASGRPDYPAPLVDELVRRLALLPGEPVADVGAGTGILTRGLLERGLEVFAVEPSTDMRTEAERQLGSYPGFRSIAGTAQATGLAGHSVATIFCAQAFHWFNEESTLHEWRRILRPKGNAVLIWNYQDEADPFVADYLAVVRSAGAEAGKTLSASWNAHLDNVLFRDSASDKISFPHQHRLDFDGLLRRTSSTSYLPKQGDRQFAELAERLRVIFDRHQADGHIAFALRTIAVFGPLDERVRPV